MQLSSVLLAAISAFAGVAPGQTAKQPTLASVVDADISNLERQMISVVEAMPEEKFDFSPESLHIPGADFKGVRSFALLVKHTAASNYAIWSPLTEIGSRRISSAATVPKT